MSKIYKLSLVSILLLSLSFHSMAQNNFFTDAGENRTVQTTGQRLIIPQKFRTAGLDVSSMKNFLWALPSENSVLYNRGNTPVIELPMPDGHFAKFHVWESSVMEPGLAAKFPEMRTFAGQGIDDPSATIRMDYNPYFGFHAQILSPNGRVYIDPYARYDINNYISYFTRDNYKYDQFICNTADNPNRTEIINAGPCRGTELYTYRLALACTGEYAVAVAGPGPTVPAVAAALLTTVNRVTGVYETEVAIRMVLVSNNDLLISLNGATDPYTNNDGVTMLGENQTNIDAVIGTSNYDIGHVVSTGGGGIANLRVPCVTGSKARGVTGLSNPVGDDFDIDYVAHEIGHQWGANHPFNSTTSSCGSGNRNGSTAYEVGSGTTIMGYAGICGTDNIQPHSDPFFHAISFDEISNYISTGNGNSCKVATATGNSLPVITAINNNGASIPVNTPFTLSGSATDANGDPITYCWEEWDLGPATAWNGGNANSTSPLFKSRIPKNAGERSFPDIAVVLAGYPANPAATMGGLKGETLPTSARTMKFRLTVRDNRAGGGSVVSSGQGCQDAFAFQVNVVGTTPFTVSIPNGGESYTAGSSQTITWDVAGTDIAPVNAAFVRISLSTDGGLTYPAILAASTANDGSEVVTYPVTPSASCRVKVEAIGNIFFDISNSNFTLLTPPGGFDFNNPAAATSGCPAPASMAITLGTISNAGFSNPITLSATGNPAGTTVGFSVNPVIPGNNTVVTLNGTNTLSSGSYVINVQGVATGAVTKNVNLTYTINPGTGPAITSQPANQTVCAGSNANFSVAATGTYQWQLSTNSGSTWTNISGATASNFSITGVTVGLSGNQYRCIVTGLCGSTNSNAATLTVNTLPVFTGQPQDLSVCAGSDVSFSVTATGTGITYQWELSTDGGTIFNPISGATSATYNFTGATLVQNNNQYRNVVSGTCTPAATSNAATLSVSSSITITANPSNSTICEATNTSFTIAASGSGLSYQWEVSTNGGTSYSPVANTGVYSGATTPTLTITAAVPSLNTNQYRCVVSNPPCNPAISTAAILIVNTFPIITAQPQNATICEGAGNTFSVTATTGVGSLSYQWQVSTNGGTSYSSIGGATNASLPLTLVTAGANGYQYRVIVTAGCGSVTSNGAILTVNTYPVISFGSIPAVICKSDPSFTLNASPSGTFSGTGVSASTFSPAAAGVGNATVTYTSTNAGCTSVSSKVIAVNECAERHRTLNQNGAAIVYPTPNKGQYNIRLNSDLYSKLGVKVYNSSGQLVKSVVFNGLTYGSVISMEMLQAPSGIYHLFLYNDENGVSGKGVRFIIQK